MVFEYLTRYSGRSMPSKDFNRREVEIKTSLKLFTMSKKYATVILTALSPK